jgi:hypothetical protein
VAEVQVTGKRIEIAHLAESDHVHQIGLSPLAFNRHFPYAAFR